MSAVMPEADRLRAQRYREAVERVGDGYFVVALDGKFTDVNDALCALFAYSKAELIGRAPADLVVDESKPRLAQHIGMNQGPGHRRGQFTGLRKDGSTFPFLIRASTFRDETGRLAGALGFVTDLSEAIGAQQAVAHSERELRGILENMQDTYYRTDSNGLIVRLSRNSVRTMGYTEEEVLGRPLADFYCNPRDRDHFLATLRANGGVVRHYEGRLRHRDGHEVWMATNAHYYYDEKGQIAGVEGTSRDITDLRNAREELRLAAQVFSAASEAVLITDSELRVLKVNPAFAEIAGLTAERAVGRSLLEFAFVDDDSMAIERLRGALENRGHWAGEVWSRRRDGSGYPCWLSVSAVRGDDNAVTHFIALLSDITERKATQARIEFLAHHDPLTLLPNRLLLRDRVEQAIGRATRSGGLLALLFIDLDEFKQINDRYGHYAGDSVLREIGQRLASCVRNTDTVCRLGGDEFVIALTDISHHRIIDEVAEKIRLELGQPITVNAGVVRIGCSVGASLYPRDGGDYETLLAAADTAMYATKRKRRVVQDCDESREAADSSAS